LAHDVFISYQQADKAIADAVCHRMEAAGVRCWIAPRDITHGKPWDDAVVDALTAAKVLVVIFSAAANASRSVVDEVKTALDAGATVMPFRIEDIRPTGGLLLHLGRVHWLDALTPPLESHIDRLIESAKRNLPAARDTEEEQAAKARRKAEDQAAWLDAKARHTIAAYDHYLTTWPTGIGALEAAAARRKVEDEEWAADARRKAEDQAAWLDAKARNTIAAYDHYLTTWPTGIGASEAAAARRKVEDEEWAAAARRKAEAELAAEAQRNKTEEERRKAEEERDAAEARRKAEEEQAAQERRKAGWILKRPDGLTGFAFSLLFIVAAAVVGANPGSISALWLWASGPSAVTAGKPLMVARNNATTAIDISAITLLDCDFPHRTILGIVLLRRLKKLRLWYGDGGGEEWTNVNFESDPIIASNSDGGDSVVLSGNYKTVTLNLGGEPDLGKCHSRPIAGSPANWFTPHFRSLPD
jgi:hypothetical protein